MRSIKPRRNQEDYHKEVKDITEIVGGISINDFEKHRSKLMQRLQKEKRKIAAAQKVSRMVVSFSHDALKKKKEMSENLSDTLQDSLKKILPMVVKDTMFHSVETAINVQHRKTTFTPHANGIPVDMIASEGQLSGLSFAMQLAMAIAFPWSRWKALLLDDPLQYSDIIHTSNLIEVLRLLVTQKGFSSFHFNA